MCCGTTAQLPLFFLVEPFVCATPLQGSPSIASVRNHLLATAKKFALNGVSEQLVDLMAQDECKFALLIHGRFVNIPPEIGPPLLQTLV